MSAIELCLRQDCMNTRAHLVQVNQKAENLNDWLDRLKQENATLRKRLAAAEANWRRCYAAVVLAHDTFIFGVEINEQTPRRCEVIETTAHIVLAMAHAVPPQAETAEVEQ